MNTNWTVIAGIIIAGIVAGGLVLWLVYFHTPTFTPDTSQTQFESGDVRSTTGVSVQTGTDTVQPVVESTLSAAKIFKIADGPIAGATLIQTVRPATSTIARFFMATNGHVFDLKLDYPGAVPKAVSNTTIPGILRVIWSERGRGALAQYLDAGVIKTVHFALPAANATSSAPVRIQFLPDGIATLDVSPDGSNVAYLLKTADGSDGYTARADGGSSKKLFSLPLSEILLSWPAQGTLLAQTASAAGVPGVAFSIDAKAGGYSPLLYAQGLTLTADRNFSRVVYQTTGTTRGTYFQNLKTGLAKPLSFNPIPELCTWSLSASTTLYCATPLSYVEPNYLDLRHLGAASAPSSLVSFDLATGFSTIVAEPGGSDGGVPSDISELSVSLDDEYLLFIRAGDRSLWGVRLKQ